MSEHNPQADELTAEEEIFGTGDEETIAQITIQERLRRFLDTYILTPLRIGWSDWRTRVGGLGILFFVLMGTVGVMVVPEPSLNAGDRYLSPFVELGLPFGTDNLGRSIAHMVVHSTPAMLKLAVAGALTTAGIGSFVGFVGGYKGGIVDRIMMTITDIQAVLPGLPLIIVLLSIVDIRDEFVVGFILAIDTWPGLARAIRSQVLTLRQESYIEAGRALGLSSPTLIKQDLVPQLAPYVLVNAAGAATGVIKASAALYFLGILGYDALNWGVMMEQAYTTGNAVSDFGRAGHWLFFPTFALSLMTFVLVLFSQGLDRVFNPRLRARHAETAPDEEGEPGAGGGVV